MDPIAIVPVRVLKAVCLLPKGDKWDEWTTLEEGEGWKRTLYYKRLIGRIALLTITESERPA
jgi:hypothetical protein